MTTVGQLHTAGEKWNADLLGHHMRWPSLVHCLRNVLEHSVSLTRRNGWMTYNLSHAVLDVVRSNVVSRSSGADDNHFFPSIILRVNKLGRMDNLSLEEFLRLDRM